MAEIGDHIRVPNLLCLHTNLVRGDRLIKSDFSWDFILLGVYVLFALSPLIVFVRFKSSVMKRVLGICAGIVELMTIAFYVRLLQVYYS